LQTRFSHFKVRSDDFIYPVYVKAKIVYVIARMKIKTVMSRHEYICLHPEDNYLIYHNRADEILVGCEGTTINFYTAITQPILERCRFQSRKQERGLKHLIDGKLTHSISLQGVYRLSDRAARYFARLLNCDRANLEPNF
jgi:hypothetical protein